MTLSTPQEVRDLESRVDVLGQFRLRRGMGVVRTPRASRRLLAFLALHARIVERAVLAGALWPEAPESCAYSSLRAALSRLRSTARMALAAGQVELGLAEGITVDIHHARALARRLLDPAVPPAPGDLGTCAVMALSAGLLPDWYDDWVLAEEDWRQLRLYALEALAGHLTAAGRWGAAAGAARAAVRGEPLRETSHAALTPGFPGGRQMCRRLCVRSQATGRCFTTNLALSRPLGCVASFRAQGTRSAAVTRCGNAERT
jgi:SARP family transcriptional regulator, regulator of embCAB operon